MDETTVWRNVALKLEVAESAATAAKDMMDRLLDVPHISENLQPHIEGLGRFRALAVEKVG
jgi:ABC-type methionine transport system ATPase subunit